MRIVLREGKYKDRIEYYFNHSEYHPILLAKNKQDLKKAIKNFYLTGHAEDLTDLLSLLKVEETKKINETEKKVRNLIREEIQRLNEGFKVGDIVKIKEKYWNDPEEGKLEYEVIDDRGSRLLIQPTEWKSGRLAPTESVMKKMVYKIK